MAHGLKLFDALAIALSFLPVVMTAVALGWWWRSLDRRGLFGITSFLALWGMESLIRRLAVGVPVINSDPASGGAVEMDAVLGGVERVLTHSFTVAILLLLTAGAFFLVWLQRAFRPR